MKLDITISGGKATLVTTEGGTETTIELEGELEPKCTDLKCHNRERD